MDYLYQQGNRTGGQIADTGAPGTLDSPGAGEIVLTGIAYTGKGSSRGTRRIEFNYNARCVGSICDDSISYVSGYYSEQLLALDRVQTCISSSACVTSNMIREYRLNYQSSRATERLLLASVQERARNDNGWVALPPTTFNWGDEQPQYSFEQLKLNGQSLVSSAEGSCNEGMDDFDFCNWGNGVTDQRPPAIRMAGDYDGNGTREMLAVIGGNRYLIGTDADGSLLGKARFNIDSSTEFITNDSLRSDADFNNDGRVDIVGIAPSASQPGAYVYAVAQWKPGAIWSNDTTPFVSDLFDIRRTNIVVPGFNGNDNEAEPINIPMIADIDSDGRKDILLLSSDGSAIDIYINNDNQAFRAGENSDMIFAGAIQLDLPDFGGNIVLARPTLQDYDGDGVVDIGIQAVVILDVDGRPVRLVDGNGAGLIGVLFNNVPRTPGSTDISQAFDYMAASQFGEAGNVSNNIGLAFDPRKTFHLPMDINGDGLTDYIYMPAGDGGEPTPQDHYWHYQLNSGDRSSLYLPAVNTEHSIGRILIANPGTPEQRVFPAYSSLLRAVDNNNDGRQELMVPGSVHAAVCHQPPEGTGDNAGVITYCPVEPDYEPNTDCDANLIAGDNEVCEVYGKGLGNNDESLYAMNVLKFVYSASQNSYSVIENDAGIISGNKFSSDDLFGDGITDTFARVGCIGQMPTEGDGGGEFDTRCASVTFTDNGAISDPPPLNQNLFIGTGRNYYHNKLQNNRTDVLDLMQSVTDGFNLKSEWDYAPLSASPDRPVSFPLYATPTREQGDSMFRGAGSEGMDDYFLFTSSMYVVSSFKRSNGTSLNSQNTTWYGYEEAVFNNKGRGFQGFKAIHTELHAPDDDTSTLAINPRTRSTTIFRQYFPYSGLIECQYTVRASDAFVAATQCPNLLSRAIDPPQINVFPFSITINTWSIRDDEEPGEAACGNHRSGTDPAVYLPYNDTSISEIRKLINPGSLVSSTATTTTLDSCGNVIEQTQDRTDHGFYTLSTTTNTYYNYDVSNWWLNKSTRSKTSNYIVYEAGDLAHEMPPTANLSGFARDGGIRITQQSFNWDSTHRQPSCILQYEGNSIIACASTPSSAPWARQNITYDTYGNTRTVTQSASNESVNRATTTTYAGEGYFPTLITNALTQNTNTVFDPATGNPIRITDANGLLTKFEYDAFGREVERYFPDNNSVQLTMPEEQYAPRTSTRYQWSGSCMSGVNCYTVTTITDGAPIVTETRDRLNRVIQSTRNGYNDLVTSGREFNGRGQVVAQTEPRYGTIPSNIGTTMSYDALGRLIHKTQDRDGGIGQLHTHYQHSGLHTRVRLTSNEVPPELSLACANNENGQLLCIDRYIGSQGQTLQTVDANGAHTMFWYDANLNPVLIEDAMGNLTGANYNAFSQRTALWDPNMGGTSTSADMTFSYNGYGELKTQTDAKGQSTSFTYDLLGRTITRNVPGIQDLWDYDPPNAVGQLETMRRNQNGQTVYERDFSYDLFVRATGHTTIINNTDSGQQTFTVQIQPDGYFGRTVSMTYPTAFADTTVPLQTYHLYNINGYLTQEGLGRHLVNTPAGQAVPYYRKIDDMSPRDQLVNVEYGNDAVDTWQYGPANGQMSTMISEVPGLPEKLADLEYRYDEFGNLELQTNHLLDAEEHFTYDQLHRLTERIIAPIPAITPIEPPLSAPVPDPQPQPLIQSEAVNYNYDPLGNIIGKSDYASNYEYLNNFYPDACPFGINGAVTPGPHAVTRVSTINRRHDGQTSFTPRRMAYDANGNLICSEDGNLTVRYDAYNLPTTIQRGSIAQAFNYGPDLQRYRQDSSGTETLYIDKLYERKDTKERYYVGGYLVIERDSGGTDQHSYTHKDRLGSTVAISNEMGDLVVQQGFGPFGKARSSNWVATDNLPGKAYDSRGFTDHEHLDNTRLIHMNGRAYDYNLGRFLSIDPVIQFPENSQSLNPYSYLMNNPMAGTDPTGYVIEDPFRNNTVCDSIFSPECAFAIDDQESSNIDQPADKNGTNGSQGTTNTGNGPNESGDEDRTQGPSALGGQGQAGNQQSTSPKSQGDGVGCSVPLQCTGGDTNFSQILDMLNTSIDGLSVIASEVISDTPILTVRPNAGLASDIRSGSVSNKFIIPVFQPVSTNAGTPQTGINVNSALRALGKGTLVVSIALTVNNNFSSRSGINDSTSNIALVGDLSAIVIAFSVGGPVGFVGGVAFSALGGTQGIANKAMFITDKVNEQASTAAGNIIKNSNEQSFRRLLNLPPALDINFE